MNSDLHSFNITHVDTIWPKNLIRFVTITAPLFLLATILLQPWEDPKLIFLDPLVAAEVAEECCSVAYGFMSQIGIMIWVTTAAVCLFASTLMFFNGAPRNLAYFALSAGLLTGWLGIDDAFLLHEKVLPALGIPQLAVLISYIVLTLFYLATSWRILLNNDLLLLAAGGSGFVISLAIDIILHTPLWVHLEDSAKFFGICCWASFHISSLIKMLLKQGISVQITPPSDEDR